MYRKNEVVEGVTSYENFRTSLLIATTFYSVVAHQQLQAGATIVEKFEDQDRFNAFYPQPKDSPKFQVNVQIVKIKAETSTFDKFGHRDALTAYLDVEMFIQVVL